MPTSKSSNRKHTKKSNHLPMMSEKNYGNIQLPNERKFSNTTLQLGRVKFTVLRNNIKVTDNCIPIKV